ncbi:MAG: Npt1/Npt2 family nucleotide transporter [Pseudomonadota bacterium]
MLKWMGKWLNIYEDEIGLFLWSGALYFLIHCSAVLFDNYTSTTFLKRFGVEHLPLIYMINSITTFFLMGILTGFMVKLPGSRLLSRMLLFCGLTVGGLRFIIPLGIDLLYPVLFILKSQYEVLLGLVFWNLANDLFNTRQSKRLFPLITAGGMVGGILGSFVTPILSKTISLDNLLLAYLVTAVMGAITVKRMGAQYPTLMISEKRGKKIKSRSSTIDEFKKVWPMMKESMLVKILIILTLIPNMAIPIMNYQFNFAVDQAFATEGGMIKFFSYFKGILNIISFVILFFVGRIYGRWGLPVALMFHPFNYMIAFFAFLFRFDVYSAMYARISTTVLRNTINNPARAVLMGLFPASYRAVIRPFLRGTIVRIGILMGSGIIIISGGWLHPKYLSILGCLLVVLWIGATIMLKRRYANILFDLISRNMIDLKSLEERDVSHLFEEKTMRAQLIQTFLSSKGPSCLWYANLIKSLGIKDLNTHILSIIKERDDGTKIALLSLLSSDAGEKSIGVFRELYAPEKQDLGIAIVKAANRLPMALSSKFNLNVLRTSPYPEVKACALAGLYWQEPDKYKMIIRSWLESDDAAQRKAGVIAAGESGDDFFISKLKEMLDQETEGAIIPFIIKGLHTLKAEGLKTLIFPYLNHPLHPVRLSVLESILIENDNDLRTIIGLMDDESETICKLSKEKIETASYQNPQVLVESLTIPRRRVREGIFDLLKSLNIRDVDVYRFAQSQLKRGYANLAEAEALRLIQESQERDLLIDHLIQKKDLRLETILRVLAVQDRSGQVRLIWRGVLSPDSRQKSNALEALEDRIGRPLSTAMIPILEHLSTTELLARGKKMFQLPDFDSAPRRLYLHLLQKQDWVTVVLTLYLMDKQGFKEIDKGLLEKMIQTENPHVRQMARMVLEGGGPHLHQKERPMEESVSIPDRILHLRSIQIFEGLSVSELAAIASVTERAVYPKGEIVIKEGEPGETMYMIISGEVSVIKGQGGDRGIELDRIRPGDYFGEMALFEDMARSATIRTNEETHLLVLHKREFTEIVREYPQIALHICKVLSQRLRNLHEKIRHSENG